MVSGKVAAKTNETKDSTNFKTTVEDKEEKKVRAVKS